MRFIVIFFFGVSAFAAESLESQIKRQQNHKILVKACEIELSEALLPISCAESASIGPEEVKLACLNAVHSAKKSEQLENTSIYMSKLHPDCLKKLHKKYADLKYRELKSKLLTSQGGDSSRQ